jgi:hypothetical protein
VWSSAPRAARTSISTGLVALPLVWARAKRQAFVRSARRGEVVQTRARRLIVLDIVGSCNASWHIFPLDSPQGLARACVYPLGIGSAGAIEVMHMKRTTKRIAAEIGPAIGDGPPQLVLLLTGW